MTHYLKYFASVYSLALVLLVTVLIFGFNLGGLLLLPTLIVSAMITAGHFATKEQRLPKQNEKIQLVWGSTTVSIIIGTFFIFFLVMMNPNAEKILLAAEQSGIALAAIVMLVLIGLHAIIFFVVYHFYLPLKLQKTR